ncbi:MAG: hypothetical protein MI784_00190, partial [Cytophagales bacterium]|nr:hypothetical protein [Cytophagales bacterium]
MNKSSIQKSSFPILMGFLALGLLDGRMQPGSYVPCVAESEFFGNKMFWVIFWKYGLFNYKCSV